VTVLWSAWSIVWFLAETRGFSLQNIHSSCRTWPAWYLLNTRSWGVRLNTEFKNEWSYYHYLLVYRKMLLVLQTVELNDWIVVNNGLKMIRKKFSWPYLRHHPTIWVDGQRTVGAGPESNQILLNALWKCCHCVAGWVIADNAEGRSAFICRVTLWEDMRAQWFFKILGAVHLMTQCHLRRLHCQYICML
jgi:hypothetical protein